MRHQVFGRKFGRNTNQRKALFKGLISSLVLKGQIKTTESKAKAIKSQVDKMVTCAKGGTLAARRELLKTLDKGAVGRLMEEVSSRFADRVSGFTQIVKIAPRKGDNAPMVLLRWVGFTPKAALSKEKKEKPKEEEKKKTAGKKDSKKTEESKKEVKRSSPKK